jgi:hypothetical protein
MAMALLRQGFAVSAVCPPGHPLRFVTGIDRIYPYGSINSIGALKSAIASSSPDIIIPCDDGVVWQLHDLHRQCPELRALIEDSLGPASSYEIIGSRAHLLATAAELGVRIPATREIDSHEDLAAWHMSSGVLKIDGSWGGTGVEIVSSRDEMLEAYDRFNKPRTASLSWKRLLVNRDPLALWSLKNSKKPRTTIQEFIHGRPANTMLAAWKGELIGLVTVEVLNSQGATGSATVIQIIRNSEIQEAATKIARRLGLHGFHGLDFILERDTNHAYLLELNPRCTQLGHLKVPGQGDLAGIFANRFMGGSMKLDTNAIQSDIVALFPQAFLLNHKNPYLSLGHHDVPWEEPALIRELLHGPWPDRQLPAKFYHFFRPPRSPVDMPIQGAEEAQPEQR